MSAPAFTRPVIMQRVAQVLKAAQVHALSNQLLRTGVQQLHEVIQSLEGEQPLTILWASDAMFVNRALVTQGQGVAHTIEAFKKLFERLKVHELTFDPHVTEEQLFAFLATFQKDWHSQTPEAVVNEAGPIRFRALGKEEIGSLGARRGRAESLPWRRRRTSRVPWAQRSPRAETRAARPSRREPKSNARTNDRVARTARPNSRAVRQDGRRGNVPCR